MVTSAKQREQIVQYKGFFYKKTMGRAYYSQWICIKTPCNGRIRISELKGGSVTIIDSHECALHGESTNK